MSTRERPPSQPRQDSTNFDLSGRRAVVTGAARGIGRAAACALAAAGAEVVAVDISAEELERTANSIAASGGVAHMIVVDVTSDSSVQDLVATVSQRGGVDILVNAAGIIRRGHSLDATVEDLEDLWKVNVRGLYAVTQALLPHMVGRNSAKIINVGSLGSLLGLENRAAYAATKGAVRQYTQSLAVDLGQYGIRANAIAPGYIATEMNRQWLETETAQRARLIKRIPLGRLGTPHDIAGAFVFLASPASDYITGQLLVVDGGWSSW
ncbi:SDR family NAD(P)-dependent oxidoreductase [Nocardia sp. CA-119907]|uniref:SDR family NAD(P)-dependent oxidoreductase n=1 Tax=Nocardia sp. CA-119907 TaxID=3239973 RepID=UPI003D97678E